jgi:hypothetical protein
MLESEIKKLTAAVTELTAALHTVRLPSADGATAITPAPAPKAQKPLTPATAAAPEPEPTPVAAAVAAPEVITPAAEAKVPTKKQLVEKFIELAQAKDREVAVKLLADFGVAKLPDLTDKTKWAPFVATVDELLAG